MEDKIFKYNLGEMVYLVSPQFIENEDKKDYKELSHVEIQRVKIISQRKYLQGRNFYRCEPSEWGDEELIFGYYDKALNKMKELLIGNFRK